MVQFESGSIVLERNRLIVEGKKKEKRRKKKVHPKARKGNRPMAKVIRLQQKAYYKGARCSPINSF